MDLPPNIDPQRILAGDMLAVLAFVEGRMPDLLAHAEWKDVFVDYHEPFVERVWCQMGPYRVYLHQIHPCKGQALVHRHGWPSAIKILRGTYVMDVGSYSGSTALAPAARLVLVPGTTYEMTDPDGHHAVMPPLTPSFSLMVTAPPWGKEGPRPSKTLGPLPSDVRAQILKMGREEYPDPESPEMTARAAETLYKYVLAGHVLPRDLALALDHGKNIASSNRIR